VPRALIHSSQHAAHACSVRRSFHALVWYVCGSLPPAGRPARRRRLHSHEACSPIDLQKHASSALDNSAILTFDLLTSRLTHAQACLVLRLPSMVLIAQAIFTARRYASAVLTVVVSLSVCLSVLVSHAGIVSKRLNVESRKQCHTIAQGF